MAAPSAYPVWMSKAGAPDMMVFDASSYANALGSGYAFGPTTPSTVVVSNAGSTVIAVTETPIQASQPDVSVADQDEIS